MVIYLTETQTAEMLSISARTLQGFRVEGGGHRKDHYSAGRGDVLGVVMICKHGEELMPGIAVKDAASVQRVKDGRGEAWAALARNKLGPIDCLIYQKEIKMTKHGGIREGAVRPAGRFRPGNIRSFSSLSLG